MQLLISFLFFILSYQVFACPGCAGSMDNPRDLLYVYVLAGFILLIYIPYYIIYKVIKKGENINQPEELLQNTESGEAARPLTSGNDSSLK